MKLFSEIKRRQVIQGAIAYAIVGWLLIQLAIALEASLELPAYVDRWVTIGVIAGFPVAIILAWLFDISLGGIRLTKDLETNVPIETTMAQAVDEAPPPKHSIAILPFADMSPDGDQEYLGDGVAEEILNALVKVTELRVSGRTSSFSFKGKDANIQSIGKILNVAHVLEGSVRSQGDRVRITAQLIQVSDGFHLWSETYDGDLTDIFDLQDTIAKQIVSELEILLDAESARLASNLTRSPEAYDEFLRGREYFYKLVGDTALPRAEKHLEKAVELDPNFDQAWAFLGLVHINMPDAVDVEDPADHYSKAETAFTRALNINPDNSVAERVKAAILTTKRDFFGAVQAYERGFKLDPENPDLIFTFGYALNSVGLHDQAITYLEKAEQLDPSFPLLQQILGLAHNAIGDSEKALVHFKKAIRLNYVPSRLLVAVKESEQGDIRAAYALMRDYMKDAPPWFISRLKSPLLRNIYFSALLRRSSFSSWLVGRSTRSRINKPGYKPVFWDAAAILRFCNPDDYFDFMRKSAFPYAMVALPFRRIFVERSNAILRHKKFPQFAEDIGLVKIWQTYGWPKQIQPNPGTDGSNLQFTVS